MAGIPFTLRIDAKEIIALKTLSKVESRPVNKLLNEAIKNSLSRRSRKERSLEANVAELRAYRKRDPGFRRAIAKYMEAEAGLDDSLEGEPREGRLVKGQFKPAGRVQTKIHKLAHARKSR
jgi:hypothetical protein